MRGDRPALRDLILEEEPVNIDLFCYEMLEELEQEEEPEEVILDPYEIVTFINECGLCHSEIAFSVRAFKSAIRSVQQQVLVGTLQFLCFECASAQASNHG